MQATATTSGGEAAAAPPTIGSSSAGGGGDAADADEFLDTIDAAEDDDVAAVTSHHQGGNASTARAAPTKESAAAVSDGQQRAGQAGSSTAPAEKEQNDPSSSSSPYQEQQQLQCCSFNQDGGCLAIGTATGFAVYNLYPSFTRSVSRRLGGGSGGRGGGVGQIEMLFRCNLMAIVGGGPEPQQQYSPPHRVLIWDDHIPREIGELTFRQVVLKVKLRKDSIAVALQDRVYVYHLADLSLRDKIYTADNPHGLLCLSTQISDMVLACPSVTIGHVRVELYGLRKTVLLEAHESALHGLALTASGSKLATASVRGTVIRIWEVSSGTCLQEFRRGIERATITCLAWSWDDAWLASTSDKGTAHIFQVTTPPSDGRQQQHHGSSSNNKQASSSLTQRFLSSVIQTVEGDAKKSVCQVRGVPHPQACAFVSDASNILAVAGWDADGNGVVLLSEFEAGQPEPRRVGYHVICPCAAAHNDVSDEARRRRRLRGWTQPETPQTPEGGRLFVGERLEVLEKNMEQIRFEEKDEFVEVLTEMHAPESKQSGDATSTGDKPGATNSAAGGAAGNGNKGLAVVAGSPVRGGAGEAESPINATDEGARSGNLDQSTAAGDSVRTEPLDDDIIGDPPTPENHQLQ